MATTEQSAAELHAEIARLQQRVDDLEQEAARRLPYRRVLESLPQKVFLKDKESRFVLVNDAFAKHFNSTAEEMIGKNDFEFSPHDLAVKYRADDQRVMQAQHYVTLIEPNDVGASRRFIEVTKSPVFDDRQNVVGVVGIFTDVTGRVRAESQLRQSRKLLQAILDNSPAIVTIKDAAGRYVMVNRRFAEFFSLAVRDVTGKTDHELFPAADADVYRANDEKVLTGGKGVEIEEVVRLPDGAHTFIVLKFPVETAMGTVLSVGGIATDITERKQSEIALKESEGRKSAILDAALDCILTMDHDGRITEFNPTAEREFGFKRADVLGKDLSATVFPPADEKGYRGRMDNYLVNRQGSMLGRHIESQAKRADGSIFPVEMGMTMVTVQGQPQMTVTLRNITARKEAEAAIRRQQRQLAEQAEQLEQRNRDLSKAYEELQDFEAQLIHSEKMAAIGQLVAGLAHEINTPVAFVLTNLSNIERNVEEVLAFSQECLKLVEPLKEVAPRLADQLVVLQEEYQVLEAAAEVRPLVEAAQKGMVRIRDLVATLRSYSRIDLRSETAFEDLNEGMRATLMLLQPLKKPEVVFELRLTDLPRIECNLGKINQVFLNLLSNAVHALGDKGTIVISSRPYAGGVEVRVRDDGPGIPLHIRKRVFDPFFTTKPVGEGTGLGLSISRRIVEGHHGRLEFSSEPGRGTEFQLWLPLRQPTPTITSKEGPATLSEA